MAYDLLDEEAEFANEEPVGGTGYEVARNRPGFMYMGSVAGEAPAREAWNAQATPADYAEPDLRGNAYAHQAALTHAAIKAQADAQAQIEASYRDAKTAGDIRAAQAAEEYARRMGIRRDVDAGESLPVALIQNWGKSTQGMGAAVKALTPPTAPRVEDFGGAKAVVQGNGQVRFIPQTIQTKEGPVEGEPLIDSQTGQPVANKVVVRSRNGGFHIVDTSPPRVPTTTAKVQLPGPDIMHPGPTISGPVEGMAKYGVTNFANLNPTVPAAPPQEVLRKVGNRVAVFDANTKRFIRYADGAP